MRQQNILLFLHEIETLKNLLRHSWTSTGRQESVAEHSWRITVMAIILADKVEERIDLLKVLKMLTIHDLPEVYAGDHHAFKGKQKNKHQKELQAMKKLLATLNDQRLEKELFELWLEFEAEETIEAKFAQAMDKLEVLIQHNESNLETWDKREYEFNLIYADDKVGFSEFLTKFRKTIKSDTKMKIKSSKNKRNFMWDEI